MAGRFISIEGGEGTGKTTQALRIVDWLKLHAIEAIRTREPGGTPGAEAIRALLLDPDHKGWGGEAEALLFAAARADHVARLIRPAMARGAWVISDRFVDSSRAYQGEAGGLGDEAILSLHRFGSGGLLPDLTLLLDMPLEDGLSRARGRDGAVQDNIGSRDTAYHDAVTAAFRRFADAEPGRFAVIDATGEPETVFAAIEPHLEALMA